MFVGVADARTRSSDARPACFAPLKGNAKIDFADCARDTGRRMSIVARIGFGLWLMAALLAPAAASAQASAPPIPTIELSAGADGPAVAPYVRYTKDPGAPDERGLAAILEAPLEAIQGQSVHFGPPGARTIVAVKVRNASDAQGSWIFTTGRGSLKYFRLFEVADGKVDLLVDGTDARAARENLLSYQAFSTEFVLDPGQEKLLLIDFVSENSTYMPLKIQTYGSFFKDRRANIALVSGVVLGLAVLIFLNFLFFSITGHRDFVWLAVAQAFFAINTIHSEGYVTIFFLSDNPLTSVGIEDMFKCGFAGAMAQFARSFVGTATRFPKTDLALRILIGAALVLMALQPGLALYPPVFRHSLHIGCWIIAVAGALFLPFVGYAAMKRVGRQLWPLFVGWASLALFIVYAAIASMGVFVWLPINWHLAGPVGLFESLMATLALGLNLKKIQADKIAADEAYARELAGRLAVSERAARLAEEKAFALETVHSQNALLHASGHDSKQVILALNSAVDALKRDPAANGELTAMLQSSADYLGEIVSTTMSGANIVGSEDDFVALGAFGGAALVEPLQMMFRAPFAAKGLTLAVRVDADITLVSDKPLLMRVLANLISNSYQYTAKGGATLTLDREGEEAVIILSDTGSGMPADIVCALNAADGRRVRADARAAGSGSGFHSAKRLIGALGGSLAITASDGGGTTIAVRLPAAYAAITPCPAEELQAGLPGWRILDFDERVAFDAALAATEGSRRRIAALTYDDTTVTRGRLSELVGLMILKPPCRELMRHPLVVRGSEQL